ncbi:MAG: hypothetical protein L6Q71_00425 [Planctomycetes bacterium]|nr:hypothetical protein [Planctomycetota bacterium]NUQ35260.1 hypothetical protein [Planctomycetaceae bacterium]
MHALDKLKRKGAEILATEDGRFTPVVFSFATLLTFGQLGGILLALFGISPAGVLNLTKEGLMNFEAWRLVTFSFSTFAPEGTAVSRAPLLAALMLYAFCLVAVFSGGIASELKLGWRRTLGLIVTIMLMQAALTIVVFAGGGASGFDSAFSPVGIALGLLCFAQMVEFERNDPRGEAELDFRLVVTAFLVLTVCVSSAFHPPFKPMLAGLVAGPVVAIALFAANRKVERVRVERKGYGEVGSLLYADEMELLTVEEVRKRTDELLAQIATGGIESLDEEQRRFLSKASRRLRDVRHGGE